MKLLRIGAPGAEKPAALVGDDRYVDLSDVVTDFDEAFFGDAPAPQRANLRRRQGQDVDAVEQHAAADEGAAAAGVANDRASPLPCRPPSPGYDRQTVPERRWRRGQADRGRARPREAGRAPLPVVVAGPRPSCAQPRVDVTTMPPPRRVGTPTTGPDCMTASLPGLLWIRSPNTMTQATWRGSTRPLRAHV